MNLQLGPACRPASGKGPLTGGPCLARLSGGGIGRMSSSPQGGAIREGAINVPPSTRVAVQLGRPSCASLLNPAQCALPPMEFGPLGISIYVFFFSKIQTFPETSFEVQI